MSSSRPHASGGGAARNYFCHHCDRAVHPFLSDSGELSCSICDGRFVEEIDLTSPNPNRIPILPPLFRPSASASPLPSASASPLPSASASFNVADIANKLGISPPPSSPQAGPVLFHPAVFLHDYVTGLVNANNNIQVVFRPGAEDGGDGAPGFPFGYKNVNNQPSWQSLLPDVKITEKLLCTVCHEEFKNGLGVTKMPCNHLYHKDCIVRRLEEGISCPLCRSEVVMDDPRSPKSVFGGRGGGGVVLASVVRGEGGTPEDARTVTRVVNVPLLFPFPGTEAPAEDKNTSNDGGGNNVEDGGNNAGNSLEESD